MELNKTSVNIFQKDESIMSFMLNILKNSFDDFSSYESKYNIAVHSIKALQTNDRFFIDDLISAKYAQIILAIKFEIAVGLKANLYYFNDPVNNDFLEDDIELYTKEKAIRNLPKRMELQQIIESLKPKASKNAFYDDIQAFFIFLESTCPKLAHFYGYCLGNTILADYVPGYSINTTHTKRYISHLESYFGTRIFAKVA